MGVPYQLTSEYAEHVRKVTKAEQEMKSVMNNNKPNPTSGGGLTNYYLVNVKHPQREEHQSYIAECEDIIEALELNFDEANIFKEIWRTANARKGNAKQGQNDLRAAEKIYHYAGRILKRTIRTKE